jgi:hypothetical protein
MRVLCIYFLSCIDEKKQNAIEEMAETCLRYSPLIAIGHRALFLEIGACRKLYSEESVSLRVQVLMQRLQCRVQVAVADDIPTALAFVKYGTNDKYDLPVEALKIYASPFRLHKSLDQVVSLLQKLGIYTPKDILIIPRQSIASRLGKETLLALQAMDNAKLMPWPRWQPQEKITETESIPEEHQILDLHPILVLFKNMLDKTLLRLRGRGHLLTSLEVSIEQEHFSIVKEPKRFWQIDFVFPQGSVHGVFPILQDRLLPNLEKYPLEASVREISIRVVKSVVGASKQRDFFSKRQEELESFYSIVSRLIERLGRERAFVASPVESYYPERSWKKKHGQKAQSLMSRLMW